MSFIIQNNKSIALWYKVLNWHEQHYIIIHWRTFVNKKFIIIELLLIIYDKIYYRIEESHKIQNFKSWQRETLHHTIPINYRKLKSFHNYSELIFLNFRRKNILLKYNIILSLKTQKKAQFLKIIEKPNMFFFFF